MKEWFKARNVWGAAIRSLPDEDAGRLAKAIWTYTMDGEVVDIEGAGQGVLAMALMALKQDEERDSTISAKRSLAGKSKQMIASDNKCNQMIANADNKNKKQNKNIETEQESEMFMGEDEAQRIAIDHEKVLNAAEDAGFKMSNDVRARLIALYAENGIEKMLNAFICCVDHGAPNLAYLKAVLKGEPRKAKADVSAQKYTQRDYGSEQNEAMERMLRIGGVG